MDPSKEYETRKGQWTCRAAEHEKTHKRMGDFRLVFFIALILLGAWLCQSRVALGVVFLIMIVGLFITGMIHDRILNARDTARRAIGFYTAGLDRLAGNWAGKGSPGTEFLDAHHPYAGDLDIFGTGSLFELLNAAQTQSGRATLASWLLAPAGADEILARQGAIAELRPNLDFRERLGLLAAEARKWIQTEQLILWARRPRALNSLIIRVLAFCLPFASLALFLTSHWQLGLASLAAQYAIVQTHRERVHQATRSISLVQADLKWLAQLLQCLELGNFKSDRLRWMDAECECEGVAASQAIGRLARLYDCIASADNQLMAFFCWWFMWETQFAFAIEAWRGRFGPFMAPWLRRLAETEALASLAGYAFEHPGDPLPELLAAPSPPQLEAEDLGHPLIVETRCVRNDVRLGPERRLMVVSGSNMSGKSTYLRAIGVNMALALAGAPVRARRLRMTPLQLGASIRTVDSLQEGASRFYAEITRLAQIVKLAKDGPALVFLLDEILGGTNSHDRRIGAACVARSLVQHGAIGLITTHDLALTRIVEEIDPPGANFHFEDQLKEGRMSFDYRLQPGIVEKSNALELMRSVGLLEENSKLQIPGSA